MHRPFERFDQLIDVLVARSQTGVQRHGLYNKLLPGQRLSSRMKPLSKQVIHCALERVAGTANLLPDLLGNILVNRKGRPHIMMLYRDAS